MVYHHSTNILYLFLLFHNLLLYDQLNKQIDKFVEILLGKDESRIKMVEKNIRLIDISNSTNLKERIYEYREFLINFDNIFIFVTC